MSTLLFSIFLAAATPPSVAVNELSRVNVSPELAAFAAEHVGQALTVRGLRVVTAGDIAATLGLERQRQLLGCTSDGSACLAEFAQALGVSFILTGSLARLGALLQVNLKVIDARTSTTRATFSGSTRDEAELPALLTRGAGSLADSLGAALSASSRTVVPAATLAVRTGPGFWLPFGLGLAVGAAGGICLGVREAAYGSLTSTSGPALSSIAAQAARDRGAATQLAAPILGGVGLAAVVAAIVVRVAAPGPEVTASITPGGASVGFAGQF